MICGNPMIVFQLIHDHYVIIWEKNREITRFFLELIDFFRFFELFEKFLDLFPENLRIFTNKLQIISRIFLALLAKKFAENSVKNFDRNFYPGITQRIQGTNKDTLDSSVGTTADLHAECRWFNHLANRLIC